MELAEDLLQTLEDILDSNAAFDLKDLAIDGHDVIDLGVLPGPDVGILLKRALDAVIDEEVPNERESLLKFIERRIG